VVFGLLAVRLSSGDPTYLPFNLAYLVLWTVPYALLVAPVAWIPMRETVAKTYTYGAMLIAAGITLPHLYVLSLPKTIDHFGAGLLLVKTLICGSAAYLLLWIAVALTSLFAE
jgi:hypothetical protein